MKTIILIYNWIAYYNNNHTYIYIHTMYVLRDILIYVYNLLMKNTGKLKVEKKK